MDTGDDLVGGGPRGGGVFGSDRLGLYWGRGQRVRMSVREAGVVTGSQVKIRLRNNKRWCLRL